MVRSSSGNLCSKLRAPLTACAAPCEMVHHSISQGQGQDRQGRLSASPRPTHAHVQLPRVQGYATWPPVAHPATPLEADRLNCYAQIPRSSTAATPPFSSSPAATPKIMNSSPSKSCIDTSSRWTSTTATCASWTSSSTSRRPTSSSTSFSWLARCKRAARRTFCVASASRTAWKTWK